MTSAAVVAVEASQVLLAQVAVAVAAVAVAVAAVVAAAAEVVAAAVKAVVVMADTTQPTASWTAKLGCTIRHIVVRMTRLARLVISRSAHR